MHVGACVSVERPLWSCLSAQYVTCDTRLRDQCKGTPCNRCVSDKTNSTGWNLLWCFIFLNHQIWMPCWLPGCYRKSSGNSILRNGENVLLAKNTNLLVRVIPVALTCTLQTNLFCFSCPEIILSTWKSRKCYFILIVSRNMVKRLSQVSAALITVFKLTENTLFSSVILPYVLSISHDSHHTKIVSSCPLLKSNINQKKVVLGMLSVCDTCIDGSVPWHYCLQGCPLKNVIATQWEIKLFCVENYL